MFMSKSDYHQFDQNESFGTGNHKFSGGDLA